MTKYYIFILQIFGSGKVSLNSLHTTFGIPCETFIIKKWCSLELISVCKNPKLKLRAFILSSTVARLIVHLSENQLNLFY